MWWQIASGLDQWEFPVAGGTGNFERIWYVHGGQPYFLASLTILPRRFFTRSSLSFEYGPSLTFAKNTAVLQSTHSIEFFKIKTKLIIRIIRFSNSFDASTLLCTETVFGTLIFYQTLRTGHSCSFGTLNCFQRFKRITLLYWPRKQKTEEITPELFALFWIPLLLMSSVSF